MMKSLSMIVLAFGALLIVACDDADDPVRPDEPQLEITVSFEPAVLFRGNGVTVMVTATNPTDEDVSIGTGSSSCALGASVEYEDGSYGILTDRACTPDFSERYVRAGETRTESWTWSGDIWQDGAKMTLPIGTYQVSGTAEGFVGEAVAVEIRDLLLPEDHVSLWVSADPQLLYEDRTTTVQVSAVNNADSPALLGHGNCALFATVEFEDAEHRLVTDRLCTADAAPLYLDPGESRVEDWIWDGRIRHAGLDETVKLPAGIYRITGQAGVTATHATYLEITGPAPEDPPQLAFSITFDLPQLTLGESVGVVVRATNTGTVPVTIYSADSCMLGGLARYRNRASPMIKGQWCFQVPTSRTLQPGDSEGGAWQWYGDIWYEGQRIRLPAGTYEVAGASSGFIGERVEFEIVE